MIPHTENNLQAILGEFPYSVKGNFSSDKIADIGFIPLMELTRENQLKAIDDGVKRLGIKKNRLEVLADVPIGSIKDLRRGKRPMEALKWQKISRILFPDPQPQVYVIGTMRGGNIFPIDGLPLITYNDGGISANREIQAVVDKLKKVSPPPGVNGQDIVAVEAMDDSHAPGILPGDFIFYNFIAEKDWDRLVNRRCVIKLEGEDYPRLRILQKDSNGFCAYAGVKINGKIEWVSRYRGTTPPEETY